MTATEKPCFEIWTGNNPITGGSIYAPIFDDEVKEFTGRSWEDLDQEEREETVRMFNISDS